MKRTIYTLSLICLPVLNGCTDEASSAQLPIDTPTCPLQLNFAQTGTASLASNASPATSSTSRSAVIGTGTGSNGKIAAIGVYVTGTDHQPYTGTGTGRYTYVTTSTDGSAAGAVWTCYAGTNTSGTASPIYVSTLQATVNAFHPANATVTGDATSGHTIPVSAGTIPAAQTFNPANNWECSATDYLVGSASATVNDFTSITAAIDMNNLSAAISKTVYMHHALARVEFQIQNSDGQYEAGYNYVKNIILESASGSTPFLTAESGNGNGKMQIDNGALTGLTAVQTLTFTPFTGSTPVQIPDKGSGLTTIGYGLAAPLSTTPTSDITLKITLGKQGNTTDDRTVSATHASFKVQWKAGYNYAYKLKLDNHILTPVSVEIGDLTETIENDHILDVD